MEYSQKCVMFSSPHHPRPIPPSMDSAGIKPRSGISLYRKNYMNSLLVQAQEVEKRSKAQSGGGSVPLK